ncbi:MAG: hypothetical protein ETSY1_31530 [Candidatus Entotheonella factor]|uniref:NACHT domain-containing protein n=1 Tax=Entotheonella factor TaxID=1429438 RepID=W4LBW8_ENTF1|nr:MAG: hypothetical protein ETSY1_31530 [Candidatus Entotheonella factor]
MPDSIVDQVVDFYEELFGQMFSEPFRAQIDNRIRRNSVLRQVEAAADAASQSLIRFFVNQEMTEQQVADILSGFNTLSDRLRLDDIANPNTTPEAIVESLLDGLPCRESVQRAIHDTVFRVALNSIVQVLMRVGAVMAEWQKLKFSDTFELPRRVTHRLNQISEQLDAIGQSGTSAADERYELLYRDYLMQRFYRVEAGTVRMTTNLEVDLRELFVMPRVIARPMRSLHDAEPDEAATLMNLAAARQFFADRNGSDQNEDEQAALEQVRDTALCVIIGAPGSGKSTFLEWLQLQIAAVEEEFVLNGQQAIPLLLRMRQLDPLDLPRGAALIEKATASQDRATLMPQGWLDRQMQAGCVLFMLDGLDEVDPQLRDRYVLPWLLELYQRYPACRYLERVAKFLRGQSLPSGFSLCSFSFLLLRLKLI